MEYHIAKFSLLVIIAIAMLVYSSNTVVIAIGYFVLIVSIYFILTAFILKSKGY